VKVEIGGLRIVAPSKDERLRAFNWTPGVAVALLFKTERLGIIGLDRDASTVTKFADDKGGDLLRKNEEEKFGRKAGFGFFPNISADGKMCLGELEAGNVPTKGATQLTVEGTAVLTCASTKKEFENKDVALKPGSKIAAEKLELTVTKAGKSEWGDKKFEVTFHGKQKLDTVAEIQFFKADGTQIKSNQNGKSEGGGMGSWSVDVTFALAEAVDVATIKILIWADMQKKKVPFAVTVDVGL
jgi:hypothetical protein